MRTLIPFTPLRSTISFLMLHYFCSYSGIAAGVNGRISFSWTILLGAGQVIPPFGIYTDSHTVFESSFSTAKIFRVGTYLGLSFADLKAITKRRFLLTSEVAEVPHQVFPNLLEHWNCHHSYIMCIRDRSILPFVLLLFSSLLLDAYYGGLCLSTCFSSRDYSTAGSEPFSVYLNFSLFFLVSISILKLDYKRLMHVFLFFFSLSLKCMLCP